MKWLNVVKLGLLIRIHVFSKHGEVNGDTKMNWICTQFLGLGLMLGGVGFLAFNIRMGIFLIYPPATGSLLLCGAGVLVLEKIRAAWGWIFITAGILLALFTGVIFLMAISLLPFLLAFGAISYGYRLFTTGRVMNNQNLQRTQSVTVFTIAVAVFSLFFSALTAVIVPKYQSIYVDLRKGVELPVLTQLIIHSYRWLWLVALLSGIVWFLTYQQILSQRRALNILKAIATCTLVYLALCFFGLYLPLLASFDTLR